MESKRRGCALRRRYGRAVCTRDAPPDEGETLTENSPPQAWHVQHGDEDYGYIVAATRADALRQANRRYGHFSLADIRKAGRNVSEFITDNPALIAGALGAGIGVGAARYGTRAAAVVGATTGVLAQHIYRRGKRSRGTV